MNNENKPNGISSEDLKVMEEIKEEENTLDFMIKEFIKGLPTEDLQNNIINIDYTALTSVVTSIEEPITEEKFNLIIKEIQNNIGMVGTKTPEIRFYNLPERLTKTVNNLGAEDIGKLVNVTGTIIAIDEPKTRLETALFICNGCMGEYRVKQSSINLVEPVICNECGNRNFKLASDDQQKYIDVKQIILEETNTNKTHQTRIKIILEDSLTHEVDINQEVNIVGIVSRDIGVTKNNDTSKLTVIKANNVLPLKEKKIDVTEEDKKQIKELAKNENILEILTNSLAPNIILDPEIKTALLCYLVKGTSVSNTTDNEIHILFIADPSTAKSSIGNYIKDFCNKYTISDGGASTGVGLIGAVVKEPVLNTNVLELGAFPKANNGHCIIDEFDKLPREETNILLGAMEQGVTNIAKANINKQVESKVSILALANPKYDRYDEYKPIKEQITFSNALLSRFDLKFLLLDKPDKEKDKLIATAMLSEEVIEEATEEVVKQINKETLKKYIEYARTVTPTLSKKAVAYATEYYITIRQDNNNTKNNVSFYDSRMLAGVINIASAIAKLKLSTEVTITEIEEAIKLNNYCLYSLGEDPETSEIDLDRYRGNYDKSDRRNRNNILEAIAELSKETVDKGVKQKDLLEYVEDTYNIKTTVFYDMLKQLETHKDITIKKTSSRGNPKVIYLTNN